MILDNRRLAIDRIIDRYHQVRDTLKFHNFLIVTIPQDPYIQSWVRKFYKAHAKAIPKSKSQVKIMFNPLDVVEVRGVQVSCSRTDINDVLGCTHQCSQDLDEILRRTNLNGLKPWLALIFEFRLLYGWRKELSLKRRR